MLPFGILHAPSISELFWLRDAIRLEDLVAFAISDGARNKDCCLVSSGSATVSALLVVELCVLTDDSVGADFVGADDVGANNVRAGWESHSSPLLLPISSIKILFRGL